MCVGAIHWAGVAQVNAGAPREEAEAIGFIEGPADLDVPRFMKERGILYEGDLLREEVLDVFKHYCAEPGYQVLAARPASCNVNPVGSPCDSPHCQAST